MTALALALCLAAAPAPGWRADAPPVSEIDLPHFKVMATQAALGTAELLSKHLEGDWSLLEDRLGGPLPEITEVRVGEGVEEMAKLDAPDSTPPRWAAGVAHPSGHLVLFDAVALRRDGGLSLVRHELAHAALGQLGGPALPRWFQEGLAVREAGEWTAESDLALVRAAHSHLPLSELERGFPEGLTDLQLAYAESASFVDYLIDQHGLAAVQKLIRLCGSGTAFEAAFQQTLGERGLAESGWLDGIKLRYTWIPVVTGSGTLFAAIAVLCVVAYARRKQHQKVRLTELALEDRAVEAANRIRAAEQRVMQTEAPDPSAASSAAGNKPTLH